MADIDKDSHFLLCDHVLVESGRFRCLMETVISLTCEKGRASAKVAIYSTSIVLLSSM